MSSNRKLRKGLAPMKTRAELQADYERVCQSLGDRTYRIEALKSEVDDLMNLAASIQAQANEAGA